jgi:hypothetical protein
MSSPTPNQDSDQASILAEAERERQRIVRSLAELGFALPGSITERYQRCGKPQCACHNPPPQLHGPYLQWSRAVKGKTVSKVLTRMIHEKFCCGPGWFVSEGVGGCLGCFGCACLVQGPSWWAGRCGDGCGDGL